MTITPMTMPPTQPRPEAEPNSQLSASLAEDLKTARDQVSSLQRELANREVDIKAFEARAAAVEAEASRRLSECEQQAQQRIDAAEQRVLAIYRSSSWRLTGPFRRAVRLARRLLGLG